MRTAYKNRLGNLKERDHSEDLDIDRIILRWIVGRWGGSGYGLDSSGCG
jgi:hypothetical protein